jgi:(p)ppGpp synthase/HD superfamily hydrolase
MELPQGSTPVDFSYAVHTDVGSKCVACRINRRLAPLSEPLQSGQTVEIITASGAQPNPAWLNFVVTGKARTNIRHQLKHQRKSESKALGRRLLDKALISLGSSLDELTERQKDHLVSHIGHGSFEQILEEIGIGNRVSSLTAHQLLAGDSNSAQQTSAGPLMIDGTEGFRINFARCCYPIPGDPIVGFISADRGVVVHTDSCHNSRDFRENAERSIQLSWSDAIEGEFSVELTIELEKSRGIIAVLASRINSLDANIEKIAVDEDDPRISKVNVVIGVHSRIHLARIMKKIRNIKSITRVSRTKH